MFSLLTVVMVVTATTGGVVASPDVPVTHAKQDTVVWEQTTTEFAQSTGANQVVVRLKPAPDIPDISRAERIALLKSHAEKSQQPIADYAAGREDVRVVTQLWLLNAVLLEVDPSTVRMAELESMPEVLEIHPNYEYIIAEGEPSKLEPFANTVTVANTEVTYGLGHLNAPLVWDEFGTRGAGVTVAVLDSGIDASHIDLNLHRDDPSDPFYGGGWAHFAQDGSRVFSRPADFHGHGTHVSGTVAGGHASGVAIGVAPDVTLLHARISDPDGSGNAFGTLIQIVAGIQWAIEEDADIISMSFGTDRTQPAFLDIVQHVESLGIVFVAAIGNNRDRLEGGATGSPADHYPVVGVGATDQNRLHAFFSQGGVRNPRIDFGFVPEGWPETYIAPDVAAPGVDVTSSLPNNQYASWQGTSMATPHVAGTAALMLSASDEELEPAEVSSAIAATAWRPLGHPEAGDTRYGAGIVDALAATRYVAADTEVVEPNDDFGTATPIQQGQSVSSILTPADVDMFAFAATQGNEVMISLTRASSNGVVAIAVYDTDQEQITMEYVGTTSPVAVTIVPKSSGLHYVQLVDVNSADGQYSLTVGRDPKSPDEPDDPQTPGEPNDNFDQATRITPGTISAELEPAGDIDFYAIDLSAGEVLDTSMSFSHSVGDLDLFVFGPDRTELGRSTSLEDVEQVRIIAPTTGTYYVIVVGFQDATGDYTLSVAVDSNDNGPTPPPDRDFGEPNDDFGQETPLPFDTALDARIAPGDSADIYAVEMAAGETLNVNLEFSHAEGDLTLFVGKPDTAPIVGSFSQSDNEVMSITATETGTYYLVIVGSDGATAEYTVTATLGTPSRDSPLRDVGEPNDQRAVSVFSGAVVNARILPLDEDAYVTLLQPGATLTADLRFAHADGDLDLLVFDSAGDLVGVGDSVTDNEFVTLTSQQGGNYFIVVLGFEEASAPYQLGITTTGQQGSSVYPEAPSESPTGAEGARGAADEKRLEAAAFQQYVTHSS